MKKSEIVEKFQNLLILKFRSEATRKVYFSCCKSFVNDKHPTDIVNLSNQYLTEYLARILGDDHVSKYNQYLSALKILYVVVLKQKNKLNNVKPIKQRPKLKTLPDFDEVVMKISSVRNIKHRAILTVLLTTGVRISELRDIKISDVDSKTMQILIRKGKGDKSGFTILTDNTLSLLREYYKKHKPKECLFEGVNGKYSKTSINNIVKKHVGNEYSAHWLRHIAITYVINKNIPMPKAKLFSRHKSDSSIAFYYHYDKSTYKDLRNVMSVVA